MDWEYKAVPDKKLCKGMKDGQCTIPRGKALGGSHAVNTMFYVRGAKKDYDDWEADGNEGWGYDSILPYFKKSETLEDSRIKLCPAYKKYHGERGPLNVFGHNESHYVAKMLISAGKELGHKFYDDANGPPNRVGLFRTQSTTKNGRRQTTAKAFLRERTNLYVIKKAHAIKVLFDDEKSVGKKATGVYLYFSNGLIQHAYAKKEVILSAGAINTPHLLMLSGIAPKELLDEFNSQTKLPIKKRADLPVGKNLQDHHVTPLYFAAPRNCCAKKKRSRNIASTVMEYLQHGSGPLSYMLDVMALLDTDRDGHADVQLMFTHLQSKNDTSFTKTLRLEDELYSKFEDMLEDNDIVEALVVQLKPKSRGSVRLNMTYPFSSPLINLNYFENEEDIDALLRGINEALKFERTAGFEKRGFKLEQISVAECEDHPVRSKDYWRCVSGFLTSTLHHFAGTAKMGPASDPTTVVDPALKVHGIEGLRVIDASVIPEIVSGNINAAVIMIAEKGAAMIKKEWSSKTNNVKTEL